MGSDLTDRDDVRLLVEEFYRSAFRDPLIGPIFTDVARMDLAHHLPIMCDFWETVLFRAGLYRRNALQLHLALNARFPLEREHFDRWLHLWAAAVDAHFAGEKAELAKEQAVRIAGSIHRRTQGRSGSDFETVRLRDTTPRPSGDGTLPAGDDLPHDGDEALPHRDDLLLHSGDTLPQRKVPR